MIRPIPLNHGVGFFSMEQLPQYAGKYREENVGRFWNYYVTPECQEWPEKVQFKDSYVIDGFSPNLNKNLHIGHIRQLALAKSLSCILNFGSHSQPRAKFVSILGASQGVFNYAQEQLQGWFDFLTFKSELYYDVLMPRDQGIVPRRKMKIQDNNCLDMNGVPLPDTEEECEVWDGPKGPVIVIRSDGRPLYAFADLAFAKLVEPTHYLTGSEQKEHFANLGLEDKHLPMGLVLGDDGKKMKSRTGDSVSANEIMNQIQEQFNPTPEPKKLAWNVLAWNFLHVARTKNVKYSPEEWTKPDAPGMYISYTYARIKSALKGEKSLWIQPKDKKVFVHKFTPTVPENWTGGDFVQPQIAAWDKATPDLEYDLIQSDADLIGLANQRAYALQRSIDNLDPAILANFTFDLASKLGVAYHSEKIAGGRYGFKYAVNYAVNELRICMWLLGMFPLEEV
jgi:arginyl-tRNA synthetase